MPSFRYIAKARDGRRLEGAVDAPDRRAALAHLTRDGVTPLSLTEAAAGGAAAAAPARRRFGSHAPARLRRGDLLILTRELADLLASGMTLGDTLQTLAQRDAAVRVRGPLLTALRDDILGGLSLSEAFAKRPETFPPLYVSLVRAGEAGGALTEALERLTRHYERLNEAREKVINALIYPAIVLTAGALTVVFILTFVMPRFMLIFSSLGSTLPLPTRMLIGISRAFTGWRGLALLAVAVFGVVLLRRAARTDTGRLRWHRLQLRLPVIRRIVSAQAYTHFAQTLASLLANGVPVLKALQIVEATVGNQVLAKEIRQARERVTDGSTISGPLAAGKVFPRMLTDMLAVGERTGDMTGALGHIARRYEHELDRSVKLMTTLIEPLLIVVMAVIVGFVVISMLLAVFDMTSGLKT